ncbi:MAG TPA: hypothetical protein VGE91_01740 [Solirubrobacterales bacterium]
MEDADSVFLVWPFLSADGAEEAADVLAAPGRRVIYLSAEAAARRPDSLWALVEQAIERSPSEWTFRRGPSFDRTGPRP